MKPRQVEAEPEPTRASKFGRRRNQSESKKCSQLS